MTEKNEKIIIPADSGQFDEDSLKIKRIRVLVFMIGGENYCVDIHQAKEVVEIQKVTRVPNAPAYISGVINLRGEVIALCDIRHFLGLEARERVKDSRAVITDITGHKTAILVDFFKEAADIEEDAIQPPLATLSAQRAQFTRGEVQINGDIYIFLDLYKLLKCDEIERLRKGEVA